MPSPERELLALRRLVRPVMFETGSAQFPLSTAGTAFLLSSRSKTFFVTAKHVVGNYPPGRLHVRRTDRSKAPLRIRDFYRISADEPGAEIEDVLVFEIEEDPPASQSRSLSIHIDPQPDAWHLSMHTAQYFLVGYPEPMNYVDYEASVVHSGQVMIAGSYDKPAVGIPYCHDLAVQNPLSLSSFSGLSGGPVFSLHQRLASASVLRFCGMVLQGSSTAGIVRFLDCTVIQAAMDEAHQPRHLRRASGDA